MTADIIAYLEDKNIPADEITLNKLAEQILQTPPEQGYLDYFKCFTMEIAISKNCYFD